MSSSIASGIDWKKYMQLELVDDRRLADRYSNEWVIHKCRVAANMALACSPNVEPRLNNGYLDEETFAYVVCQMVIRVMRWTDLKSETNGSYTYENRSPQDNPPSYDASPNLYVSKREKQLLLGYDEGNGPIGTVFVGVNRIWGL